MTIKSRIKKDIPKQIWRFPKLTKGKPYIFHGWKTDRNGTECLYYKFEGANNKEHIKRVLLKEIGAAVRRFKKSGIFNNSDYRSICAVTSSNGPCGYPVIGRYLEFRHKAKYKGRGCGFSQ